MFSRRSLTVLILVVALGLAATFGRAYAANDAAGFVNEMVSQALKALDDKQMTDEQRAREFRQLLDADFDMPRIAKFVLGHYWIEASEQDRQRFQKLFEEYVVRAYAARFSQYSGEVIKVTGSRPESETSTLVQSQVIRPGGAPPAKVDWRVRKDDRGFKVIDVDVEGVSMVLTQREEFSSVIQRAGGIPGLNKELEQKLAAGDASLAAPMLPQKR